MLWIFHTANTVGGSFNSVLEILDRRHRDRVHVLGALPAPGSCAQDFRARDVESVFLPEVAAGASWAYVKSVLAFVRVILRERIDVVYVSDYVTWRSSALAAAMLTRTPYVVHVRFPLADDEVADPWLVKAAAVIGNSSATLKPLTGQVSPENLHVIYNFVDFSRFETRRDIRGEFFAGHPPVIGFVGFFRPEKGVEYFLEMAGLIRTQRPDVRFLAVGGESTVKDEGWFERMRAYAVALGVDDIVHFAGLRKDIPDIMASIDVLVVPSLNEGFGRVIIEANAAGVPVVGANAAGIPEVIEDGLTGILVPPRDSQAMAVAVLKLLADERWRQEFASSVPARVRARFAPDRQVSRLEDVWCAVAGRTKDGLATQVTHD